MPQDNSTLVNDDITLEDLNKLITKLEEELLKSASDSKASENYDS